MDLRNQVPRPLCVRREMKPGLTHVNNNNNKISGERKCRVVQRVPSRTRRKLVQVSIQRQRTVRPSPSPDIGYWLPLATPHTPHPFRLLHPRPHPHCPFPIFSSPFIFSQKPFLLPWNGSEQLLSTIIVATTYLVVPSGSLFGRSPHSERSHPSEACFHFLTAPFPAQSIATR